MPRKNYEKIGKSKGSLYEGPGQRGSKVSKKGSGKSLERGSKTGPTESFKGSGKSLYRGI